MYFLILCLMFYIPVTGTTLIGDSYNPFYNYLPCMIWFLGVFLLKKQIPLHDIARNTSARLFFFWFFLSMLFILVFYTNKFANFWSLAGIVVVHISVMFFLYQEASWTRFIRALFWFVLSFIAINLFIQLFLPPWIGEYIFNRIIDADQVSAYYRPLFEAITSGKTLEFPMIKDHNAAFIVLIGFSISIALLMFPGQLQSFKLGRIPVILFAIICLILIVLIQSRVTMISTVLIIVAAMIYSDRRYYPFYLFFLIPVVIAFGLTSFLFYEQFFTDVIFDDILPFFVNFDDPIKILRSRDIIVSFHMTLVAEQPWTGWGVRLPYDLFGYDTHTDPTSEAALTYTLASQGLIRGGLFISLIVLAIVRQARLARTHFYHMALFLISLYFLPAYVVLSVFATSSAHYKTLIIILLAISCYVEPVAIIETQAVMPLHRGQNRLSPIEPGQSDLNQGCKKGRNQGNRIYREIR